MLDEAKRLADLNKRRELKQAGLLSSTARTKAMSGKRKRGEMDLGVEIPFHKPAPVGFHDTTDEDRRADMIRNKRLRDVNVKQINESQYRTRDREEKEAQKREAARIRALERSNMQLIVAEISKTNDPVAVRKRGILSMPQPTVTDSELEKISKMALDEGVEHKSLTLASQGGKATDALLGDYEDRVLPTPMRTNMGSDRSSKQDAILRAASNLRMLEQGQTPLLGGENPSLHEKISSLQSSKYGSQTPMIGKICFTDVKHTNNHKYDLIKFNTLENEGGADTPMISHGRINEHRDQLGLNRMDMAGDDVSVSATSFATTITGRTKTIKEIAREERLALKQARKELEMALAALPSPQFEYEIAIPEAITEEDDHETKIIVRDAIDVVDEKRDEFLSEVRSSVLKRQDIPRPFGMIEYFGVDPDSYLDDNALSASRLILDEMYLQLAHDAHSKPCLVQDIVKDRDKKDKSKRRQDLQMTLPPKPPKSILTVSEDEFKLAKLLLDEELKNADAQNTHRRETAVEDITVGKKLNAIKQEFQSVKDATNYLTKRAEKIEAKLNIKNQGYAKRSFGVKQDILLHLAELQNKKIESEVFSMLLLQEEKGFELRVKKLQDEIDVLRETEKEAQKRYGLLLHEKNRFLVKLKSKEICDAPK